VNGGPLELTRAQVLAHRRRANGLERRRPFSAESLERVAWAGLQDSMPRAALLSIHARVEGTRPDTWQHPAYVQVWGLRFSVYVVAERDRAIFTLGRLPDDGPGRRRAEEMAERVQRLLGDGSLTQNEAGHALGVHPNALRYAAPTGSLLIRWDGARGCPVWVVPRPAVEPAAARNELARRYLHVFGPATANGFAGWAGINPPAARAAFDALADELTPARSPTGEGHVLATDEVSFLADPSPAGGVRLLPSGDAYTLLQGADRHLLVPATRNQAALWTPRVWPGSLLIDGEIAGTWRRDQGRLTVEPWRHLSAGERTAVEVEAAAFPLPGLKGPIEVRWAS
jgi:hypothetical protein